jgi:hypothetical protein
LHFVTSTTTAVATPSANTLPCETCTAHAPSFNFVAVAIGLALLSAYLLGRSHGRRSFLDRFRELFGSQPKGRG